MTELEQETRLALVERELNDLKYFLHGNGRPGKLEVIETKVDDLNNKLSKVITIVAILASSSGGIAGYLAKTLLGG